MTTPPIPENLQMHLRSILQDLQQILDASLPEGTTLQIRDQLQRLGQEAVEWASVVASAPPGIRPFVLESAYGAMEMQGKALEAKVKELLSEAKWAGFWNGLEDIASRALGKLVSAAGPLLERLAWQLIERLVKGQK